MVLNICQHDVKGQSPWLSRPQNGIRYISQIRREVLIRMHICSLINLFVAHFLNCVSWPNLQCIFFQILNFSTWLSRLLGVSHVKRPVFSGCGSVKRGHSLSKHYLINPIPITHGNCLLLSHLLMYLCRLYLWQTI